MLLAPCQGDRGERGEVDEGKGGRAIRSVSTRHAQHMQKQEHVTSTGHGVAGASAKENLAGMLRVVLRGHELDVRVLGPSSGHFGRAKLRQVSELCGKELVFGSGRAHQLGGE